MNILFIIIDTLRYDFVGYSRNFKGSKTPILDEVAKESFVYDYAFTSGTSTPFAFPGILASVYSSQSRKPGVVDAKRTFAEYLRQKDYLTLGFNGGNGFVSNLYGYNRGVSYFKKPFFVKPRSGLRKCLKKVLDKLNLYNAIKQIRRKIERIERALLNKPLIYSAQDQIEDLFRVLRENKTRRFFAFIDFMEVHGPYFGLWKESLRNRFRMYDFIMDKLYGNHERKWLEFNKYLYARGLEMIDRQIGNLLNLLDMIGLLKNTIVVITSDHGEEFLEHGNYDHLPKPFDEIIRVPLIIKVGNEKISPIERESERGKLVSLVDLLPSITMYLFNEKPKEFVGKSTLLNENEAREYIYSEGFRQINGIRHDPEKNGPLNWCIRTMSLKYIEFNGNRYLFDLKSDPREQKAIRLNHEDEISLELMNYIREFKRELLRYSLQTRLNFKLK